MNSRTSSRRAAGASRGVEKDVLTRRLTVLAQDPVIKGPRGAALTTQVEIPAERLEAGPKGHRIHVIDYDATTNNYYKPRESDLSADVFESETDIDKLVGNPWFHQQNVYGITMATLGEFEAALGRNVEWGFDSPAHQLKVAPHAFADANAYYSRESESLNFGYFTGKSGRTVFTCLSHDIIAHECSHALLDGLRSFYLYPSHPDQGAFHEGFSDVIALLSVLKSPELMTQSLSDVTDKHNLIRNVFLNRDELAENVLLKLAEEFGQELAFVRGDALRHSVTLPPSPKYLDQPEYQEPHRRGEILSAAIMGSFLSVWERRLDPIGRERGLDLNRIVVADEAVTAAQHLTRIAIRALDYLPPVDMTYSDYLSALLTADQQLYPDDRKYHYRDVLRAAFAAFGILPAANAKAGGDWNSVVDKPFVYDGLHFEALQRDPNAVFRFIWENRNALEIDSEAFTRVISIRPCVRVSNDGFVLRETVAEYVQTLQAQAYELRRFGIPKPTGLSNQTTLRLYGGGTLIFNEFGRLKYHIGTGVRSSRQGERLQSLFDRGVFNRDATNLGSFARLHRERMTSQLVVPGEQW